MDMEIVNTYVWWMTWVVTPCIAMALLAATILLLRRPGLGPRTFLMGAAMLGLGIGECTAYDRGAGTVGVAIGAMLITLSLGLLACGIVKWIEETDFRP